MTLHEHARNSSNRLLQLVLCGIAVLCLVGCSTAKPAPQAAALPQPAKTTTKRLTSAPVSQSSSLEQMQQGNVVGTPSSSPLKDVYFDFDRYDLRPDVRETLKANADWLRQNPMASVQIEGHCDERGTAEYNLALGAKRAQTAKEYITTMGVAAERLSTISYGQELPVCTEHNEDCWQKNRHDRFVIKAVPTS